MDNTAHSSAAPRECLRLPNSRSQARLLWEKLVLGHASPEAWALLGQHWSSCDAMFTARTALDELFREYRAARGFPIVEAMDADARAMYDSLPPLVTVYRGC